MSIVPRRQHSGTSSIPQPLPSISCQDLLHGLKNYRKEGFLYRKTNTAESLELAGLGKVKFLGKAIDKINWARRYIVIHNGSLYTYDGPFSKKTTECDSLYGFKVIKRANITDSKWKWSFEVVNAFQNQRDIIFSAASEEEMKKWMTAIHKEMLVVKSNTGSGLGNRQERLLRDSAEQWEYGAIEMPVFRDDEIPALGYGDEDIPCIKYDQNSRPTGSGRRPLPPKPTNNEFSTPANRGPKVLPDARPPVQRKHTGQTNHSHSRNRARAESPIAEISTSGPGQPELSPVRRRPEILSPKPVPLNSSTKDKLPKEWAILKELHDEGTIGDAFWNGDKDEGKFVLKQTCDPGAYLVRNGNGTKPINLTLVVLGKDRNVLNYKITIEKEKGSFVYHIYSEAKFNSADEMLQYYTENLLPTGNITLANPHSQYT